MILHGENLIIKIDGTAIAAAKSCAVQIDCEQTKVSSPTDGEWEHYKPGRKSWSVTTSHLVTGLAQNVVMIGSVVQLSMHVSAPQGEVAGIPFGRRLEVDEILLQSAANPDAIIFDTNTNTFCAEVKNVDPLRPSVYMNNWTGRTQVYITPKVGAIYRDAEDTLWVWNGTTLVEVAELSGSAIVKTWQGTFSKNSLAQGQFSFQGNGPLK